MESGLRARRRDHGRRRSDQGCDERGGCGIPTRGEPLRSPESPEFASRMPLETGRGRLSLRNVKHFSSLTGGADGTRTRDPRRDRPVRALANMSEEERTLLGAKLSIPTRRQKARSGIWLIPTEL